MITQPCLFSSNVSNGTNINRLKNMLSKSQLLDSQVCIILWSYTVRLRLSSLAANSKSTNDDIITPSLPHMFNTMPAQ